MDTKLRRHNFKQVLNSVKNENEILQIRYLGTLVANGWLWTLWRRRSTPLLAQAKNIPVELIKVVGPPYILNDFALDTWGIEAKRCLPCVCENTVIWFIFSHEESTWRTFCMYWVFYVLWLLCKGGWATTDKNIYLNFPPCALSPLVKSAFFLVWYYVQCKIRKGPLRSYAVQIVEIQFVSFEFFFIIITYILIFY